MCGVGEVGRGGGDRQGLHRLSRRVQRGASGSKGELQAPHENLTRVSPASPPGEVVMHHAWSNQQVQKEHCHHVTVDGSVNFLRALPSGAMVMHENSPHYVKERHGMHVSCARCGMVCMDLVVAGSDVKADLSDQSA